MMWSAYEGNGGISGQVLVTIESPDTAHIHPTPEVQALLIELRLTRNIADFDAACRRHGIEPAKW